MAGKVNTHTQTSRLKIQLWNAGSDFVPLRGGVVWCEAYRRTCIQAPIQDLCAGAANIKYEALKFKSNWELLRQCYESFFCGLLLELRGANNHILTIDYL